MALGIVVTRMWEPPFNLSSLVVIKEDIFRGQAQQRNAAQHSPKTNKIRCTYTPPTLHLN